MLPVSPELIALIALLGLNIIIAIIFARKLQLIQKRIELVTRSSYYNSKDIRTQTSNVKYYGEQQLKLFEHQRLLLTTMQVQMRKLQNVCDKIESSGRISDTARQAQFDRIKKASTNKTDPKNLKSLAVELPATNKQPVKTKQETVRKFADLMISADNSFGRTPEATKKIVKLASIFEQNSEFPAAAGQSECEKVKVNER